MTQEAQSSMLHRARLKALFKRIIVTIFIFVLCYSAIAMVYASKTFYKVRQNYAFILETLSGERKAVSRVGWHIRLPIFTKLELEVPLMNQELHLGNSIEPKRIMSRGNVALWTSAMLTYRIRDLHRWGIENRSPLTLLQTDFDGIVKDVMQGETINELISDRVRIKEQIYRTLKDTPINEGGLTLEEKYGIEVISFVLRDTRYGEKLAAASEEKKRRELIAEAENYAADLEASRTRKLYAAYSESIQQMRQSLGISSANDPSLFDFLNQQKWAAAYEKNQQGQNTFVLNNTATAVPVTLPSAVTSMPQAAEEDPRGLPYAPKP
ncbi:Regulator of protease activity HflC, stomatin/prohibitin superfamily [Malonomonas rubra DSM 5091]|uniref:Regulator of protease activity HflC, stomatin/prohibitin superfamily n=1 Tax=Malonomonas rubra DSM 5091 TaxID=1122189 RepID=A0A1M6CKE1_MALRU|nr:SPFH domain-containing protein [Malonomonas rubra]SHI61439.1 Regulator of protease activity HflC, stomatin/prohibitin superfamily [Malonomonas rubra DSM 5091]